MPLLLLFGSVLLVVIVVARGLRSRTALG
jgi:hypothetical protein